MSSGSETPGRLPESEWDFEKMIEEGVIPKDEIHHCFFYEYARSSNAVKEMVEYMRKSKFLYEEGMDESGVKDIEIMKHKHWEVISFLIDMPGFPGKTWRKALDDKIERMIEEHSGGSGQHDFSAEYLSKLREAIRLVFLGSLQPRWRWRSPLRFWTPKSIDSGKLKLKSQYLYDGPFHSRSTASEETLSFLIINWGNTDKVLGEEFWRFLKKYRPKEFPAPKPDLLQQTVQGDYLPFRKDHALKWLGIWRRKKEVKEISGQEQDPWMNYIDFYPESRIKKLSKKQMSAQVARIEKLSKEQLSTQVQSRHAKGRLAALQAENARRKGLSKEKMSAEVAKRSLRQQFKRAELILKWIEKGGRVVQKDNKGRLFWEPDGK